MGVLLKCQQDEDDYFTADCLCSFPDSIASRAHSTDHSHYPLLVKTLMFCAWNDNYMTQIISVTVETGEI